MTLHYQQKDWQIARDDRGGADELQRQHGHDRVLLRLQPASDVTVM